MKEYGIYIKCGGGLPYMIHFYDNIESAKLKLYDMINLEESRGRIYFVDNDFYNNKYPYSLNSKYYCIKEREVTEFIKYSEKETEEKESNKILFFNDYKKINNY